MQDSVPEANRFKPEMPRIPGVNDRSATLWKFGAKFYILAAAGIVSVAILGRLVLRRPDSQVHSAPTSASRTLPAEAVSVPVPQPVPQPPPSQPHLTDAGTIEELSKPWSAKEFTFADPITHAETPAMVVRLPGVSANRSGSYWAFSLVAPYEPCQLEYVTDLSVVASRYGYRASHPMVVASCDGTLYDPLRMGTTPAGAWVRGAVAQGAGIRPPIAIEIRIQGRSIVADRIE